MGDVLAFAEQRDGSIRSVAAEVLSVAGEVAEGLDGAVHALAVGAPGLSERVAELGRFGASRVRVAEHEAMGEYHGEGYAAVVADAVREGGYAAGLFPASAQCRDLAPRVAALLDVPLATDITGFEASADGLTVTRPVYAGKAFVRITFDSSPVIASLRPNVFPVRERDAEAEVEAYAPDVDPSSWRSRVVGFEASSGSALDVAEASVVVSGGRGMRDPEHWHLLEDLRDAIGDGSTLGASRAVVDAGWRPHAEQVGQTGKTVAPKLYFAIGISGAIQHLAGMRTAGIIVAVNKDPDAPIFGVADYGIVGDLFDVVPRLTEEIGKLRGGG